MNSFVAVVQNNYIFTNRLSGLSVGDSVYHYDKLGDKKSVHLWEQYPLYYCNRNEKGMLNKYIYQGTGKITQLYKVVDIVHLNVNDLQHLEHLEGYNNQAYLITVTHIKDLDMELGDFVSWNKIKHICGNFDDWVGDNYEELCNVCPMTKFGEYKVNTSPHNLCEGACCDEAKGYYLDNLYDENILTKYTGICKVLRIGGAKE
jgi:hypothetical protein